MRAILCCILSLIFILFLRPTHSIRKSYVVYLGGHSHGKQVSSVDLHRVKHSHHQLLGTYLGRHINGFAAMLEEEEAAEIAKNPEVISVFLNRAKQLQTTRSWEFVGLEGEGGLIHEGSIWKKARFGEDTIIANLDGGVWPESKSFSDEGFGPIPKRKLIGARYFNKGYSSVVGTLNSSSFFTPRDVNGHGSHTLSTAGGNFVAGANVFGLGNGTAKGGSPKARVAAYKVCWSEGCTDADILAGFDRAIEDGVDVLSVSLAADQHRQYFEDSLAIGSFHAVKNGIVVVASAGNYGPASGSVVNVAPWLITVGANTMDRQFQSNVVLGNNKHYTLVLLAYSKRSILSWSPLQKSDLLLDMPALDSLHLSTPRFLKFEKVWRGEKFSKLTLKAKGKNAVLIIASWDVKMVDDKKHRVRSPIVVKQQRRLNPHPSRLLDSVGFHQIIASLEKLHYVDSNCYSKALRVLEAVAKYKLCVMLLDFDYILAVNVFQLFLKIISLKHTNAVLRDMVDIMSQLIEERDEVSLDFQVSILDSLRKRTLATAPCSTLLGKEVLEKCHARLKPCLLQLMTDMNMNLDDYCNVLGSVLHGVPEGENMVENVGSVPPVEGTSALQLPQVPLLDATPTMNNNSNLEPGTWSSLDINATSVVLPLPAVTGKQSIPDVLAPSSTKTNISHGSPCKRGQPRKNHTDLTVRRRSERIRSAERQISPRKQSIPDVLAPSSTKTNINYGSPCKRGQPRKNQTDVTGRRRSERIRSAERKSKEKAVGKADFTYLTMRKRSEGTRSSKGNCGRSSCKNEASPSLTDSKKLHIIKGYGKELVGAKVKVWWPLDKRFYEGVVSSFNPKMKKHKVIYTDDDGEMLKT
nr:subtilisin-like protease SBT5.3 [Ipomoea batatas]